MNGEWAGTGARPYELETRRRRSIRLREYDYSRAGAYFVTVCVQDRACVFGEVTENESRLNEAGRMVQAVWEEMSVHYPGIETDAFVVMPNHIHGIIVLGARGAGDRGQPRGVAPTGLFQTGTGPGEGGEARQVAPAGLFRPGAGPNNLGPPQTVPSSELPFVGAGPRACPPPGASPGPDRDDVGRPRPDTPAAPLTLSDALHRFKTMTTKRYTDGVKQSGWPPYRGRLWQRNYFEHVIRDEKTLAGIRQYILDNPIRWSVDAENPTVTEPEREMAWQG